MTASGIASIANIHGIYVAFSAVYINAILIRHAYLLLESAL
jgi:hypothetical protein